MNPYELAMCAARDAGNRSMRKGGRSKWSTQDWNVHVAEFERLYPQAREMAEESAQGPGERRDEVLGIPGRVETPEPLEGRRERT